MTAVLLLLATISSTTFLVRSLRIGLISTSGWWFVCLNLIFFLPSFAWAWIQEGAQEGTGTAMGVQVISIGLVASIAGIDFIGARPKKVSTQRRTDALELNRPPDKNADRTLTAISLAVFIPAWTYFALLGHVPLFMGISDAVSMGYGGLGSLQTHRLEATPHLAGIQIPFKGLLDLARNYGTLFTISISCVQILWGYKKAPRFAVILLSIITALAGGQRWPMIYVLVCVTIASYSMSSAGRKPKFQRAMRSLAFLVVVGLLLSVLQQRGGSGATSISGAIQGASRELTNRIFVEQSFTPLLSFQNSVYAAGELHGASYIQSVMAYLPGVDVHNFEVDFFARVYGSNYGFTAAPGFFVEAYINFGRVGVALITFTWGILLASIDIWRKSAKVDEFHPGLYAGVATLLACTSFAGAGLLISVVLVTAIIAGVHFVSTWGLADRTANPNEGRTRRTRVQRAS